LDLPPPQPASSAPARSATTTRVESFPTDDPFLETPALCLRVAGQASYRLLRVLSRLWPPAMTF
jgi:hypothetical protein